MNDKEKIAELKSQISAIESQAPEAPASSRVCASVSAVPYDAQADNEEVLDTQDKALEPKDKDLDSATAAFNKITDLVRVRDHSTQEISERLTRAGFNEQARLEALRRAEDCGLLDDKRFADVFIRSRLNQGKGVFAIERELKKHGIVANELDGWPDSYGISEESELKRASDYIRTHPSRAKNKGAGIYRKLINRGFSQRVARSVAHLDDL